MSWIDDTRALDQRIRGLIEAANFFVRALAVDSEDAYSVCDNYLCPEARRIFEEVEALRDRYACLLPPTAIGAMNRFIESARGLMIGADVKGKQGLKARLAPLAAFRAELAYHLSDRTAMAHRL